MKRKTILLSLVLVLVTVPAFTQDSRLELMGWITSADFSGEDEDDENNVGDRFSLDFDSAKGYGAAIRFYWTPSISTEVAASVIKPDANFVFPISGGNLGTSQDLELLPITAVIQFHLRGERRFDPYIGGGVGYLLIDDITNLDDFADADVGAIDLDDDYGFVVNAGVGFRLTPNFSINLDAKYISLDSEAQVTFVRGDFVEKRELAIDPLIISGGIGFRF